MCTRGARLARNSSAADDHAGLHHQLRQPQAAQQRRLATLVGAGDDDEATPSASRSLPTTGAPDRAASPTSYSPRAVSSRAAAGRTVGRVQARPAAAQPFVESDAAEVERGLPAQLGEEPQDVLGRLCQHVREVRESPILQVDERLGSDARPPRAPSSVCSSGRRAPSTSRHVLLVAPGVHRTRSATTAAVPRRAVITIPPGNRRRLRWSSTRSNHSSGMAAAMPASKAVSPSDRKSAAVVIGEAAQGTKRFEEGLQDRDEVADRGGRVLREPPGAYGHALPDASGGHLVQLLDAGRPLEQVVQDRLSPLDLADFQQGAQQRARRPPRARKDRPPPGTRSHHALRGRAPGLRCPRSLRWSGGHPGPGATGGPSWREPPAKRGASSPWSRARISAYVGPPLGCLTTLKVRIVGSCRVDLAHQADTAGPSVGELVEERDAHAHAVTLHDLRSGPGVRAARRPAPWWR